MVGPGEVDDELQPEVVEECNKYGEVVKVIIYEVSVYSTLSLLHVLHSRNCHKSTFAYIFELQCSP